MSNKNMIAQVAMTNQNDQSIFSRVQRIYDKQQHLCGRLLEINNIMVNGDTSPEPEPCIVCIMDYLEATESVLNSTLDLVNNILQNTR